MQQSRKHQIQAALQRKVAPRLRMKRAHGCSQLTARLRQAGAMMFCCQLRRDPGLACSRMVGRFPHVRRLRKWTPNPTRNPVMDVNAKNKSTHHNPSSRGLRPRQRKRSVEASPRDLLAVSASQPAMLTQTAPASPHHTERLKVMTCARPTSRLTDPAPVTPKIQLRRYRGVR